MNNNIISLDELKLALHIHGHCNSCFYCPLFGIARCDHILVNSALYYIDQLQL